MPTSGPDAVFRRWSRGRPPVVGHRGVRSQPPVENTPAAFAAAAAAGADWVELDVRRSADGVAVLHHNPRLPDGLPLLALTATELAERGVTRLDVALAAMPHGLGLDVEVKNLPGEVDFDEREAVVGAVAEAIAPLAGSRPLLVSAFSPATVGALRGALPTVPAGLVCFSTTPLQVAAEVAGEYGARVVCAQLGAPGLDADGVSALHARGLEVLVWTVNDTAAALALAEAGVDAVCTDHPAEIRAALNGVGRSGR